MEIRFLFNIKELLTKWGVQDQYTLIINIVFFMVVILLLAYLSDVITFKIQVSIIKNDMTFLVSHLQPTEKGIPMEIYVFSKDQRWAYYEGIQADIFDHVLAVIPEFELRYFKIQADKILECL
ncbi:MAG: hypothetical protein JW894_03700 [Bacteroidales bacterium]|nr:hypothetical protein [Bacteroidales bacterium]